MDTTQRTTQDAGDTGTGWIGGVIYIYYIIYIVSNLKSRPGPTLSLGYMRAGGEAAPRRPLPFAEDPGGKEPSFGSVRQRSERGGSGVGAC